ncbi:MAG TPA: TetR/AcrR family transcriptional regulator C-terminal domain-containing protein, partial [Trebonia sp.]|nr:TetR/AcrR family transcriptional regulator C-terminal domain-containing protein [Trebonia sp.]
NFVRTELANQAAEPAVRARQFAQLPELLATGRYPRFAAAVAQGGEPQAMDLAANFDRLLDKLLDGLVR